ncbi:GHKL domain-containing protein [Sphingobacteriales bacterium UPWRP_1]|nr:hypothetical protein BVG80_02095 [Sphingobacteriales bacterium TSM_CSM]PSJ75152.1 GHKL domain-containing protein [Sphingobacteriales bacterium UPWRP_1]
MENGVQFTGLNKKWWLLSGATILLFLVSLVILQLGQRTGNLTAVAGNVSRQLDKQEKDFYRLLDNDNLLRRVATDSYTNEDLELLTQKPYSILLYQNGRLVYWNNNEIVPEKPYWYEDYRPGVRYEKFQNAIYQLVIRQYQSSGQASLSGITAVALFPVEYRYEIENQYLTNRVNPLLEAPGNIAFSLTQTENAVRTGNTTAHTSLYLHYRQPVAEGAVNWAVVILQVIALLLVLFMLYRVASYLCAGRGLADAAVFLGITLFLLRVICTLTGIPHTLKNVSQFAELPNGTPLFPSLGDLLVNMALIALFLSFVYQNSKTPNSGDVYHNANGNGRVVKLVKFTAGLLLAGFVALAIIQVLYLMVSNFNVSFDLSAFSAFDLNTPAALITIIFLFASLFYVLQLLGLYFSKIPVSFLHRAGGVVFWCAGYAVLYALHLATPMHLILLTGMALWLLLMPFLQIPANHVFLNFKGVVWVLLFSALATLMLTYQSYSYEKQVRERFAKKKSIQEDNTLEAKFTGIAKQIMLEDEIVRKYYTSKPLLPSDELLNRIKKKYLRDFADKYNIKNILPFNVDGYCLDEKNRLVYLKEFNRRIGANSINTTNNYLYLIPNEINGYNYLSKLPVFQPEDSVLAPIGYLIIEMEPKTGRTESVYPELIIEDRFRETKGVEDYSYAIYQNNEMEINRGSFSYPLQQPSVFKPDSGEVATYITYKGYSHLIYQRPGSDTSANKAIKEDIRPPAKIVVISKPDSFLMPLMSLFVMFILIAFICAFSVILLNAAFNIKKGREVLRHIIYSTLQRRISFSMLVLVFLTFILVGFVTIRSFYQRSTENHRAQLMQKQKEALATIENMIEATVHRRSIQMQLDNSSLGTIAETPKIARNDILNNTDDMADMLRVASRIYDIDMNLYDNAGQLIASSQPDIFNRGLLSGRMNPFAWNQMAKEKNNQFIQNEQIGSLSYLSAYIPVKNEVGNAVNAYLNLPYFARQKVFKHELLAFIGYLLNVYLIMFIIATLLAIFTARELTTPLRLMSNKLKDIKLGQTNELLHWPHNDEMGTLVEQYNKTIIELDKSVKKLAESERQSAWKEMARQVAHEIKNPLTPMKLSIQHLLRASRDNHPKIKEMTERIAKSLVEQIDILSDIATEFSTFAKMPKPNNELVNIKEVLNNVVTLYDDSIHIQYPAPHKDFMVFADRSQLLRVFTNIIKNAIQAIPDDREGQVRVTTEQTANSVIIAIADNGIGIPKELEQKVFAPNFTTHSSGMGLGLAMTQNIVHAVNGKIWFTSIVNEGTTFFVELPLVKADVETMPPAFLNQ